MKSFVVYFCWQLNHHLCCRKVFFCIRNLAPRSSIKSIDWTRNTSPSISSEWCSAQHYTTKVASCDLFFSVNITQFMMFPSKMLGGLSQPSSPVRQFIPLRAFSKVVIVLCRKVNFHLFLPTVQDFVLVIKTLSCMLTLNQPCLLLMAGLKMA